MNREDSSRDYINRDNLSRDIFSLKAILNWEELFQPFCAQDKKYRVFIVMKNIKNIKLQMTILGGGTSSCTVGGFTGSSRRTLRDGCNKESGSILHTVE
jgi:hypothetical protein